MAAPTVTARTTPTGIPLTEGYQILIASALKPALKHWEKSVKLPSIDMGDPIDIATQHNVEWLTVVSAHLAAMGEIVVVGSFDPDVYNELISIKGVNHAWTMILPDGSTISFWGYMKKAEGPDAKKKEQPDLTMTVQPTNFDPTNRVEAGPYIVSVAGT